MAGAIVQNRESSVGAVSSTTIALAFSSANTAGNNLWVVGHSGSSTDTPTVADSASNTYSARLDTVSDSTNNNAVGHWQCQNCAAATPTVTVTFNATIEYRCIWIVEVSGCQNAANDGHNGQHQPNVGTGTDAVSSGAASNASTAFMLALTVDDAWLGLPNAGTGFTSAATGWNFGGATTVMARLEYKASVAAASNAGKFTATNAGSDTNTVMVMLAESGGGGGSSRPPFMIGDLTGIGSPGRFFKDRLQ